MAAEVGTAYVSIIPETRRFGSLLSKQITSPVRRQGVTSGKSFGSAFGLGLKSIGAGLAVLGVGAIAKQAVDLEASFSQTMNTIAAVTNTPRKGVARNTSASRATHASSPIGPAIPVSTTMQPSS